jgi:DNA-binding IscR family transcriptional regulator
MSANSRLTTAVHVLCWLELAARRGYPSLTSERVADSLASNPALVRKALGPLRRAGLVASGHGPGAGWSLARPAAGIRLDEVYGALGDDPSFALHPHEPNQECPVGFGIRPVLGELYADADAAVRRTLARHTVADVLDQLLTEHPLPGGVSGMVRPSRTG